MTCRMNALAARWWAPGLVLAGVTSGEARAQDSRYLIPSLTVSEFYDDNLFSTPSAVESDYITRVGLGLEAGHESTPLTVIGRASLAGEVFDKHKDFNTARARTEGQLSLSYLPNRRLAFAFAGEYLETQTPSELNDLSGLVLGRARARRWSAAPSVAFRLGRRSNLTGELSQTNDTLEGGFTDDTQTAGAAFEHRVSTRDILSLGYLHRRYSFSTRETSNADLALLGWTRDFGARTRLTLKGGPRRTSSGDVGPELEGLLRHRLKRGELSLTYLKTQATTLGQGGVLDTDSLVLGLSLRPAKWLEIIAAPGAYRNRQPGLEINAYRVHLETLLHFSRWFHAGTAYSFDLQHGNFGAGGDRIRRNVFEARLLISPQRAKRPQPRPIGLEPEPEPPLEPEGE